MRPGGALCLGMPPATGVGTRGAGACALRDEQRRFDGTDARDELRSLCRLTIGSRCLWLVIAEVWTRRQSRAPVVHDRGRERRPAGGALWSSRAARCWRRSASPPERDPSDRGRERGAPGEHRPPHEVGRRQRLEFTAIPAGRPAEGARGEVVCALPQPFTAGSPMPKGSHADSDLWMIAPGLASVATRVRADVARGRVRPRPFCRTPSARGEKLERFDDASHDTLHRRDCEHARRRRRRRRGRGADARFGPWSRAASRISSGMAREPATSSATTCAGPAIQPASAATDARWGPDGPAPGPAPDPLRRGSDGGVQPADTNAAAPAAPFPTPGMGVQHRHAHERREGIAHDPLAAALTSPRPCVRPSGPVRPAGVASRQAIPEVGDGTLRRAARAHARLHDALATGDVSFVGRHFARDPATRDRHRPAGMVVGRA